MDLALNDFQWLILFEAKLNQTEPSKKDTTKEQA